MIFRPLRSPELRAENPRLRPFGPLASISDTCERLPHLWCGKAPRDRQWGREALMARGHHFRWRDTIHSVHLSPRGESKSEQMFCHEVTATNEIGTVLSHSGKGWNGMNFVLRGKAVLVGAGDTGFCGLRLSAARTGSIAYHAVCGYDQPP